MSVEQHVGETDHFWYRLQSAGPYVDSQHDNLAFGRGDGALFLSEDNAESWAHTAPFPDAGNVTFSHILDNGDVLFATRTRLFLASDRLQTVVPVPVRNADGSNCLPHTPLDPDNPGWYFHTLSGINSWSIDGKQMIVWGNYCNVRGGATPVNIYYSTDGGHTVSIAYAFGQNPHWQESDPSGRGRPGTLLGNPDNAVICRHVHIVSYNPEEDAFYACTGDGDKLEGFECHWLRGTYDWGQDTWDWRVIISDHTNSRYKAGGISFVDGMLYWISDSNGPEPYDRGIFRCAPQDIGSPETHTLLFNPEVESGNMIIQDNVILASHCAPASPMATGIIISTDSGETWAQYDLKELGARSPTRFHPKNSDGWFRMDLRKGWIDYGDVLFLKPKTRSAGCHGDGVPVTSA